MCENWQKQGRPVRHIIMHIAKRRWRVEKAMCWDTVSDSQRKGLRLNMYKVWREMRFGLEWMLGSVSVLDVSCLLCLQWIVKHHWVHCENLESVLGSCVHNTKLLFIQISQQKQNCIKGVCLENTIQSFRSIADQFQRQINGNIASFEVYGNI